MSQAAETIVREIIGTHKAMVAEFEQTEVAVLVDIATMIAETFKAGGTVYLCGNGGSAADAQHIAGEMVGRFQSERRALPAVALSTDTSVLTCVANDYDYESVFARQAEALLRQGDVLWAISTSGSSANVVKAVEVAKGKGARVVAFTGRKNSTVEGLADLCLCADASLTARSQEIHQLAYHIICDLVERRFAEQVEQLIDAG